MAQELLVTLARADEAPLHLQLERGIRDAIRSGRLAPGTVLPSSRTLAQDLEVSRGVVVEAYDQLIAEGYLISRRGSATRVAPTRTQPAPVRETGREEARPRYDFRLGVPNLGAFPRHEWLASLRKVVRETPDPSLGYVAPQGTIELRVALSDYLGRARGVVADAPRVVICSGYSQGLKLVCDTLRARGAKRIIMEDPSQAHQRDVVTRAGLEAVGLPVDDEGLRTDLLDTVVADAALVTPAHQFPTGGVMGPDRRLALCSWAERQGAIVIEDDYDAEYRYDREPIGALQGLAPERVVYASSASKTLAPGLRLGWLVSPSWLAADVADGKANDDLGSPALDQLALADFISTGRFDRHLRRNRTIYRRRRDALVGALSRHLPDAVVEGVAAGLHLVVTLPRGLDESLVVERAARLSVGVESMAKHRFPTSEGPPAILLGYGSISEAAVEPGIRILKRVIDGLARDAQTEPRRKR